MVNRFIILWLVLFAVKSSWAANTTYATNVLPSNGNRQVTKAMTTLGQRLFFDPRLSTNGLVSCASCHQSTKQFSDGLSLAIGIHGRKGTRNTPSLLDVVEQRSLFWDGRRQSLEGQALDPLLNPSEHGLPDEATLLQRLRSDRFYQRAFQAAFAPATQQHAKQPATEVVTAANLSAALAAFQRSLVSSPTPFDRYQAGESAALSPAARRGWVLFSTTAQCIRCHSAEGPRPLFTDHGFHSLAVGLHRIDGKLPELTQKLVQLHRDGPAFDQAVLADADMAELGRFAVTLNPADIAKYKTPGLRNVALTAPYMHDGSVATLEEAVDLELYYRGAQDGRPLILTPAERADLVVFLRALNSEIPATAAKTLSSAKPGVARRQRP